MNVETILNAKGRTVIWIAPDASVGQAVDLLRAKGIGALVVSGDGISVAGIISERDVVQGLAERGPKLVDLPVAALMTRHVFTCKPTDGVAELMA
ncbi:MAG: CBS domain-containing protein, partial [Stellaceae bacterium]